MSVDSLLASFIVPLERERIPYAITGSVASIAYGEPRMTLDIDLVAVLEAPSAARILAAFPEERFYAPPLNVIVSECGRAGGGHFNVIDHESGLKADFYVGQPDPLQRFAIEGRRRLELGGFAAWLAPPEYVIVRKLESWHEGGSAKHVRDIRGMLACSDRIDRAMIAALARERGIEDLWNQAR